MVNQTVYTSCPRIIIYAMTKYDLISIVVKLPENARGVLTVLCTNLEYIKKRVPKGYWLTGVQLYEVFIIVWRNKDCQNIRRI